MLIKSLCILILFYLQTGAIPSASQEVNPLEVLEEKLLLETELELCQGPNLHFLFNLRDRKIYLEARGMVLREWQLETVRFWGDPVPLKAITLIKKSTLFPPGREKIKPGETQASTKVEIDALEVDDMPGSYTLYLEGRVRVYIKTKAGGFFSGLASIGHALRWFTAPPLLTVWYSLSKRSFTAIYIVIKDRREAQALYWTLTEGSACVLLPYRDKLMPVDKDQKLITRGDK
jgi:hypothetical protein